jgi:hypothetical protein
MPVISGNHYAQIMPVISGNHYARVHNNEWLPYHPGQQTWEEGTKKQRKLSGSRRATHSLVTCIDQLRVGGKEVEREGILHFLSTSRTALGHEQFSPILPGDNTVNMFPRQRIHTQQ